MKYLIIYVNYVRVSLPLPHTHTKFYLFIVFIIIINYLINKNKLIEHLNT